MSPKNIVLMILTAGFSFSAFAGDATLARYTHSDGAVAPKYRKFVLCEISDAGVVQQTTIGGVPGMPIKKQVAWTAEVKDAKALQALSAKAKQGKLEKGPGRVGGGTDIFASIASDGSEVALLSTGGKNVKNKSKAAATIVEFIKFNCLKQ